MKTITIFLFITFGIVQAAFTETDNEPLNTEHRHVVLCVTNIIKRYFTHGWHLLISLPSGHSVKLGTLDHILHNIHNEMKWQIHVIRQKALITTHNDYNKPQSYVIFLQPESSDSDTNLDLSTQVKFIRSNVFLNSRSRFLVVACEQLTKSPQFMALNIFKKLYKSYRILDLIVVISVHMPDNSRLRENFTDIEMQNLYVYIWFPITPNEGHDQVTDVTYLDTLLVEEQRRLLNHERLFSEKIPLHLKDMPIKLSSYLPDFRNLSHQRSKTQNGRNPNFSRIEIDFISSILQPLNLKISYDVQTTGNISEVDLYIELITKVISGESDIAVGGLPLDGRLANFLEPTIPYFQTSLSWYVPCAKPLGRPGMIFRVLKSPVWVCCGVTFLTVAATTWLLATHTKVSEYKCYKDIASCCHILWSVTLGVSVPKMPHTPRLRLVFLHWVVHCFVITIVFQAFFTSFLVQPDMGKQITTVEELVNSGLEYGYTSVFDKYIEDIDDSYYSEIKKHRSTCVGYTSCVEKVITSDFATISSPYIADYVLTSKMSSGLIYPICPLSDKVVAYSMSMYLSNGNPLLNSINQIIRRLTESGLAGRYFRNFINVSMTEVRSLTDIKKGYAHNREKYTVLSLSHLHLAFLNLFVGFGISFVSFLCEVIYPKFKKRCIFI